MEDNHLERADTEAAEDPSPRWLTIRVGEEPYAIPAGEVVEIATPREATRVPGAPATVLGLINHRGSVVTVVDLGRLLGRPRMSEPDYRLVLVRQGANLIALATADVMGFGTRREDGSIPPFLDLEELLRDVF